MNNTGTRATIAVVAKFTNSIAIWNCIKQHIDLMLSSGNNILIFVPAEESLEYIQENYRDKMVVFHSKKELKSKAISNHIDIIWYPTNVAMLQYGRPFKSCKVLLWIQGTDADESWMRNHSKIRVMALNMIEKRVFNKADGLIYVSESMRDFFEKKYSRTFSNYAVIPCLSDFHDYKPHSERIPESYVYIGGLSAWQCFDEIVELYSKVRSNKSIFHVITMDVENAKRIVSAKVTNPNDITVYSIKDRTKIPDILSQFQYGFLIRKESPVNYVSSPIKFLEYISCGVDVIMTNAVPSYAKMVSENGIGTIVDVDSPKKIEINKFSDKARFVYEKHFERKNFVEDYKKMIESALKA